MEQHLFVFPKGQMTNRISLLLLSEIMYLIIRQDLIIIKAGMGGDVGRPLFLCPIFFVPNCVPKRNINVRHLCCL